ncbi:MAG: hypothetical protein ACNS60_09380 [Candidatus Cyclobacteriaceae bacterium M2_1C_046]
MRTLLLLSFLSVVFAAKAQDQSRSIIISADYGYGGFSWVEKFNTEVDNYFGDPLYTLTEKATIKGYRIGPGINALYSTGKWGIGVSYGRYLYQQTWAELLYNRFDYRTIPFNNINEYGALVRYQLFEKRRFIITGEMAAGIFTIQNDIPNLFRYKNELFLNPALNISYDLGKISFSLSPNYNFMYTKLVTNAGETIFNDYVSSFNIALGAEVNIFRW